MDDTLTLETYDLDDLIDLRSSNFEDDFSFLALLLYSSMAVSNFFYNNIKSYSERFPLYIN